MRSITPNSQLTLWKYQTGNKAVNNTIYSQRMGTWYDNKGILIQIKWMKSTPKSRQNINVRAGSYWANFWTITLSTWRKSPNRTSAARKYYLIPTPHELSIHHMTLPEALPLSLPARPQPRAPLAHLSGEPDPSCEPSQACPTAAHTI